MNLPHGIDLIVGMDFMLENDVILLARSQTVMFGGALSCYGKPDVLPDVGSMADRGMTRGACPVHDLSSDVSVQQIRQHVNPVQTTAAVTAKSVTAPGSRDLKAGINSGAGSDSSGVTQWARLASLVSL
jgi:hypothetical protein